MPRRTAEHKQTRALSMEPLEPRHMLSIHPLTDHTVDALRTSAAAEMATHVVALSGEGESSAGIALAPSTARIGSVSIASGFSEVQGRNVPIDTKGNVAFQGNGAQPAVTSTPLAGYAIHQPQFLNDGRIGNGSSFIAAEPNGWAKIDVGTVTIIDAIRLGRDRTGHYGDRDPGRIIVAVATTDAIYAQNDCTNDATEYVTVFDSATTAFQGNFNPGETWEITFPPVAARYVKVTVEKAGACLDEMEVREAQGPIASMMLQALHHATVTETQPEDSAERETSTQEQEQTDNDHRMQDAQEHANALSTVDAMSTAMAIQYTNLLQDYETSALLRDIAEAERMYPILIAEQKAAQEALRLFEAQSWYQRSAYCNQTCKRTPLALLSPADKAISDMIENAFTYAFPHLDAAAAGKAQEAAHYLNAIEGMLLRYKQRGTYEYQQAQKYALYIPRSNSIVGEAKAVRNQLSNVRTVVAAKDAAVLKHLSDQTERTRRLKACDLNLRRQAPALDGNTPEEAAIIDGIIEQAMQEGLHTQVDLQAQRMRTGARVDLENDVLHARMTDVEFGTLAQDIASAVTHSQGTVQQVTNAVRTALLHHTALKDILDRSHTLITRYNASPVMADILEHAEAASEIPYARMFVEHRLINADLGYFTVRVRNPGPTTVITASTGPYSLNYEGQNTVRIIRHPNGLADGRVDFETLRSPSGYLQQVQFHLYADEAQTMLLDRVVATYHKGNGLGGIVTEQRAWNDYEEGKLERVPIEPKLRIYGTHKHNVLVAVQSPGDQSLVTFARGGMLDTTHLQHNGGTTYAMGTATFNVSLPSGQYPLYLYERPNGLLLDTVLFQWDKALQTLTPVDLAQGAPDIPANNTQAAAALAYFQTASTMDEQIFYGEQPWQRILHSEVFERTKDFPAPYNLIYDLYESFYDMHPELRSENIEATIDAEWAARGNSWTRKQIRDNVYSRRKDMLWKMNDSCIEYSIALGEIMGKAVEGMQKIRKGHDPATAFRDVHTLWEKYENPFNANGYGFRAHCVDAIQELTGLRLPTPEVAIEIARRVIDTLMVRLQEMILDHERTAQRLVNSGYHLNGDGYWVPNSTYTPSTFNPDLDALSRTAARFSRWFGQEIAMADPRLSTVTQNDSQRVIVAALEQHSAQDAPPMEINRIFDVALATTTDYEVGGFTLQDGIVTNEAMSFIDLRIALRTYDDATLMREAEKWYRRTGTPGHYPTYGDQSVRDDTAAGRIFNGLMQQAMTKQGVEMRLVLCIAERIIGIRTIALFNLLKAGDTAGFFTALMNDFRTRNFDNIFVSQPGALPETTHIAGFTLDRNNYTEQDTCIRLTFDVAGADPTFSQWNVYLADMAGNALPGVPPLLPANAMGSLSASIPLSRISEVLSQSFQQRTFTLRLAVWKNPTDTAGLPGDRISKPFTVIMRPWSTEGGNMDTGHSLRHLSDDPVENAVLNQLTFPVTPGGWSYGMGSKYHKGSLLYSLDLNSTNDRDKPVTVAATGTVVKVDLANGWVHMRHETPDGQIWYSNSRHMTHILEDVIGMTYTAPEEAKHRFMDATVAAVGLTTAQKAIDALIAQGLTLTQNAPLGLVGNEGDSDGSHLHFDAYLADSTPINLFSLAEEMQPGFTISGSAGGKTVSMQWDKTEMSLVNATESILIERRNITDSNGTVTGAENIAYAWHADLSQREELIWVEKLSDGSVINAWLNPEHTKKWNSTQRTWEQF